MESAEQPTENEVSRIYLVRRVGLGLSITVPADYASSYNLKVGSPVRITWGKSSPVLKVVPLKEQ